MAAGRYDIIIEQGAHFELTFEVSDNGVPRNFTPDVGPPYTGRMQIRSIHPSVTVLAELTTENGKMILNGDEVVISLTAAETASLSSGNIGVYDLELVPPDNKIERLLQGLVSVSPEATR